MIQSKVIFNCNLILVVVCATFLVSCSVQNNSEKDETSSISASLGVAVPQLDKQIWSIFQDQNNHFWYGTRNDGVLRYDGKQIVRYTEKDGLISNSVRGISGDKKGNVYIQSGDGISKFDGATFTTLKPIISESNEWKLNPNDMWFNLAGNAHEVYRYDGKKLYELSLPRQDLKKAFRIETKGVQFKGMNNSPYAVYGLNLDKSGNLWIGTVSAGAFRYDGKSFLWFGEMELSTLPDGRVPGVRSMLEDKNGFHWLSNFKSKYRVTEDGKSITYQKLEGIDKTSFDYEGHLPYFLSGISDKNGNLWMATYGSGAFNYDGEKLVNYQLRDGETEVLLLGVYEDRGGNIWLTSDNAGVYKFNGNHFEKYTPNVNQ